MRVLITTTQVPFVSGGAEILAEQLKQALITAGHEAEIVSIPFKWYPPERILDQMLGCRLLDLTESCGVPVDKVIGLKFPAYLIPHPNKVLWLLHQHRTAYELWDHPEYGDLIRYPNGSVIRDAIHMADKQLIPEAKGIFTISANVSKRLNRYCNIDSVPIYHPPQNHDKFYCGEDHGYLFFPSRLTPIKRQFLVLEALVRTKQPVRIRFAGSADTPAYAEQLKTMASELKISDRVDWLGHITEEEKQKNYAHARGVVYTPVDEDYGYITLEAMLSSKPVITCSDSGGTLEFVADKENGLVTEPTPVALAAAFDELWQNVSQAATWGRLGLEKYKNMNINWSHVIERLLA